MTKPKDRSTRDAGKPGESPLGLPHARAGGKPEKAFDIWLKDGLHQLFDNVAREPIPDSLLKLIEDDRNS